MDKLRFIGRPTTVPPAPSSASSGGGGGGAAGSPPSPPSPRDRGSAARRRRLELRRIAREKSGPWDGARASHATARAAAEADEDGEEPQGSTLGLALFHVVFVLDAKERRGLHAWKVSRQRSPSSESRFETLSDS